MSFITGGAFGIFLTVIFAEPLLRFAIKRDIGLATVALAPIVIILYALIFGTIGGILGIIIYNIVKHYRRKHN